MKKNNNTLGISILSLFLSVAIVSVASGAGSQSIQPEVGKDVKYYNKGVEMLMDKKFESAEKQFRKALEKNQDFAEAHNNLAYALRKQGSDNFDEALAHYNQAVNLNPNLPEPYMYRGVLHVQMGNKELASNDHRILEKLNPTLAKELEYVIENEKEKEPEQFFGVTPKK